MPLLAALAAYDAVRILAGRKLLRLGEQAVERHLESPAVPVDAVALGQLSLDASIVGPGVRKL
jgi:hypothetical protein